MPAEATLSAYHEPRPTRVAALAPAVEQEIREAEDYVFERVDA